MQWSSFFDKVSGLRTATVAKKGSVTGYFFIGLLTF